MTSPAATGLLLAEGISEAEAQFLAGLDQLGVPLLISRPGGTEFLHPSGWPKFTADGNKARLARWHPGDALLGLLGAPVVVIDVDSRNGGDSKRAAAMLAELNVRVSARVFTPGNGVHFYVAGHPDIATVHGLTDWPGVDIQSFGGLVFLPGTLRPKYDGGGYAIVENNLEALADGGDPDGAEALAGWVAEHHRASRFAEDRPTSPLWDGTPPDARQESYLERTLDRSREKLSATPKGTRNAAAFQAGLNAGNWIAGAGLDEARAVEAILQACRDNGLVADDGERQTLASIRSGIRAGKTRPAAVPPEAPALTLGNGQEPRMEDAPKDDETDDPKAEDGVFVAHTIAELRERVRHNPRKFLIRGVWVQGAYGIHSAEQKAQKSWNALDMAVSVASGTDWLGHYPVDLPGPVLVFIGEGGENDVLRRLDAIAESRNITLDDLPIRVCTRLPELKKKEHVAEFRQLVLECTPVLVILDPLYLAAAGVNFAALNEVGALLAKPQQVCQEANTALLVIHHNNRAAGVAGGRRISGAGAAEWGRVLLVATVDPKASTTDKVTKESRKTAIVELSGDNVADDRFRVFRRIRADDPSDPESPLRYSVTVLPDEDDAGTLPPAARRVLAVMRQSPAATESEPLTVREIGDRLANDGGLPLKVRTIQSALGQVEAAGLSDRITTPGVPMQAWLTAEGLAGNPA